MPDDQSRPTQLPQKFRRSRSIDPASPNASISGSTEFHHGPRWATGGSVDNDPITSACAIPRDERQAGRKS